MTKQETLTLDLDPEVLEEGRRGAVPGLGHRIRLARERRNLSQRELGLATGLSKESIYRMEVLPIDIRSSYAVAIAHALGVQVQWLLEGDEA